MEIFKPIPIYQLFKYEISNHGRIRNIRTGRIMKLCKKKDGHLFIRVLYEGKKYNFHIHRLVYSVFNGVILSNKMVINHIDNVKSNNHIDNLEELTVADNTRHYFNNFYKARKTISKVKIRELYSSRTWETLDDFYNALINL